MEELYAKGKGMHKLSLTNRGALALNGVVDVISFDLNEVLVETEAGMLMIKGKDLHVNKLNLEKGEVDIEGMIDVLSYSQVPISAKKSENLFGKWFK